jgi:hypothetical protein
MKTIFRKFVKDSICKIEIEVELEIEIEVEIEHSNFHTNTSAKICVICGNKLRTQI